MRKVRKIRNQEVPTFAFVVDGNTEIWYLQMLKRNERHIRLKIKPEIPNNKSIEDQFNLVKELSGLEYSKVFWIVDLDTIIKESRETLKGNKITLKIFMDYYENLKRNFDNVVTIINNPCLEYWFLLHFKKTSKIFETCKKAETQLKNYIENYEKTQKYFTKQDNDIYLKLKPYLKTAISNANSLGQFDSENPLKALCGMHLLFNSSELKKYFE